MSRTLHKHSPAIKLCAEEKKLNKQKKMIDACCDADFTKAVTECCWNVTHGRAPLSTHKIQQLKRHKALLRKLSNSSIPIKQRKIAIQRGDIQTYKGKMTTKMILIPIDRLKALDKISTDTPAKLSADVEFKLLQQNKNLRPRVREPEQKKEISMDSTMHHMQEPQRARIKHTLDHMAEHDGNIKYDKYTGEIHYDGVKAPDSDVRELLSTLTSKKKRITAPKRWDLFMRSLKDTDAPADIHLGWKWNKSVEKGD